MLVLPVAALPKSKIFFSDVSSKKVIIFSEKY